MRLTPLSPACGPCRSRKLDARRFNAAPIGLLRTQPLRGVSSPGARAGAGSVGGWVWSRGPPLSPGGSETDLSTRTSNGSALPEGFAEPRHGPEIPAFPTLRPRGFNSPGSGSLQDESCRSPRLVPRPRGIRRRVDPVPKSPLRRRPFGLCLEGANPRFDVWMMRCRIDSGNCEPADLSTFGSFASGQGWITQRFVASRTVYPRSGGLSGRKAPLTCGRAVPKDAGEAR